MLAVRTPLSACCLTLLLWLGAALPAGAHTLITVTLEMVAEDGELTINLSVSPLDIIACLAPRSPSTRGQLRALDALLGPYLLGRLAVGCDGVAVGGTYAGYLPDLLQPGAAIVADEALPTKLSFVLTWKLPASAAHLQVGVSLFSEEGLPGFCQLILESGAGRKRQVAYVELGKSWTFTLHGGGEAVAPMPPALSQALLPGTGAPGAPPSFAQLIGNGLRTLIGWVPLLLSVLLVALHPATLRTVLLQTALFALAQVVGLAGIACLGPGPGVAPMGMLAAAAVVALALGNLRARPDARALPRLLLLAALGLLQGWALCGAAHAGGYVLDGGAVQLVGFALGLAIGEGGLIGVAVGATAWSWVGDRHRRYVVVPSSLLAALFAMLWAVLRLMGQPPIPG
jgi:hypothetical protein